MEPSGGPYFIYLTFIWQEIKSHWDLFDMWNLGNLVCKNSKKVFERRLQTGPHIKTGPMVFSCLELTCLQKHLPYNTQNKRAINKQVQILQETTSWLLIQSM